MAKETLEQLKQENQALKDVLAAAKQSLGDSLAVNDQLATKVAELEQHKQENQALKNKLAATEKSLEDTLAVNDQLATKVTELEQQAKAAPAAIVASANSFVHQGVTYGFTSPKCKHKENIITPAEVCADKALQAELIAMGSGFIVAQ